MQIASPTLLDGKQTFVKEFRIVEGQLDFFILFSQSRLAGEVVSHWNKNHVIIYIKQMAYMYHAIHMALIVISNNFQKYDIHSIVSVKSSFSSDLLSYTFWTADRKIILDQCGRL